MLLVERRAKAEHYSTWRVRHSRFLQRKKERARLKTTQRLNRSFTSIFAQVQAEWEALNGSSVEWTIKT